MYIYIHIPDKAIYVYIYIHVYRLGFPDKAFELDQEIECMRIKAAKERTKEEGVCTCICMYIHIYTYVYTYI
jgi:hypothetical protein